MQRSLKRGDLVDGYRLGARVGVGGFAEVFHAFPDTPPDQDLPPLCLKIGYRGIEGYPVPTVAESRYDAVALFFPTGTRPRITPVSAADTAEILETEFRLLKRVQSPLLPAVFDLKQWEGFTFYTMEYIEGQSLRDALSERRRPDKVARITAGLIRLVDDLLVLQMRERRFYHGDLKPENILLTATGLRLIDPAVSLAAIATLTPAYNPLGLHDERADTGAIALILFEIATGVCLFANLDEVAAGLFPILPIPEEERARREARFLNLERYGGYRSDPWMARLLDWIARPPTYAEMRADLRAL